MQLKLIVGPDATGEECAEVARQLELLGHSISHPAGVAGRQHIRHSIKGADRLKQDLNAIQNAQSVLLVNCSGSCPASMLVELGAAAYMLKRIYLMHPTGDALIEEDLSMMLLNGDLGLIPKEILG